MMKNLTQSVCAVGMAAALSLAAAAPASAATTQAPVQFVKGSRSAALNGQITGYNVMQYRFYAKKGQVFSVERLAGTAPQIQLSLLDGKNNADLSGNYQVLPATGYYTLQISQTRNDARKAPKQTRPYRLKIHINHSDNTSKALSGVQNVTYRCDNGRLLKAQFTQRNGQPVVRFQYGKIQDTLAFSTQYSQAGNPVFGNSNDAYSLSLQADGADYAQSRIYSLISYQKHKDGKAIAQECIPVR